MATKKVTVTLEAEQVEAIGRLVAAGTARSISAFVQHAVAISLQDVAGWGAMLAQALAESGGPMSRAEREWADSILAGARKTKRKHKGKRKAA